MKKLTAFVLALALCLSLCTVTAFAEVTVDGSSRGTGTVLVDSAQYVSAEATGDDLTVTGNVTGDGTYNSVYAAGGGEINVGGTVTGNISWGGDAIFAMNDSTKVVVAGTVTEEAGGSAINALSGAAVEVGNVVENNSGDAIKAVDGTASTVTVNGDVTEKGGGHAIEVNGSGTITVKGSVTEEDDGNAIYAQNGATVKVYGSVVENDNGTAINAVGTSTKVMVGGNVTENGGQAAIAGSGTVIVEGKVTGEIWTGSALYLGQLEGNISFGANMIHYLIGTAADSPVKLSNVTLESEIVADGTIDGVKKVGYRYTTTADATDLKGKTIILKPADGKKLTVSGFDGAAVTYVANDDGSVTFTIGESFKGGLQNLVLTVTDILNPNPNPGHGYSAPSGHLVTSDLTSVTKVTVDGKAVDSKYYTVSGGNVTLTDAFMKTLANGKHTVKLYNGDVVATGTMTVSGNAAVVSAKTADAGIALYGVLSVSSLLGMGWVRKRKH